VASAHGVKRCLKNKRQKEKDNRNSNKNLDLIRNGMLFAYHFSLYFNLKG
jgi:hypothetical protein